MDPQPKDGVVLVPVPQEHLGVVYSVLASLMGRESTTATVGPSFADEIPCPHCGSSAYLGGAAGQYHCGECGLVFQTPDGVLVDHENGCWTEQMIERLRREIQSENVQEALSLIARRSPEAITSDELRSALNVEPHNLRAELAGLSKTSRRLFGRKIWPMSARQGWGDGTRMGYRMPPQIAEWWLNGAQPSGNERTGVLPTGRSR